MSLRLARPPTLCGLLPERTTSELSPTLRAFLQRHGYVGPNTVTAPRGSLETDLQALVKSGSPAHGSGGQLAAENVQLGTGDFFNADTSRWQFQLPPDFRRGAPEIYSKTCDTVAAPVSVTT